MLLVESVTRWKCILCGKTHIPREDAIACARRCKEEHDDDRPITEQGMPQTYPADEPKVDPLVCFLDASEQMARLLGKNTDLDVSDPLLKLLAIMSNSAIRMETERPMRRGPELSAALAAALAPGHAIARVIEGGKS